MKSLPRTRGGHPPWEPIGVALGLSSPHLRGVIRPSPESPDPTGAFFPRVRGSSFFDGLTEPGAGVLPACAGVIRRRCCAATRSCPPPRVCGGHPWQAPLAGAVVTSSPHVRGSSPVHGELASFGVPFPRMRGVIPWCLHGPTRGHFSGGAGADSCLGRRVTVGGGNVVANQSERNSDIRSSRVQVGKVSSRTRGGSSMDGGAIRGIVGVSPWRGSAWPNGLVRLGYERRGMRRPWLRPPALFRIRRPGR
jgi:hypothetical protein